MIRFDSKKDLDHYDNLYHQIYEKDKEIERLNKDLDTAIEICNNRQKEIVRLNNIIDELEKELKELKGSDK